MARRLLYPEFVTTRDERDQPARRTLPRGARPADTPAGNGSRGARSTPARSALAGCVALLAAVFLAGDAASAPLGPPRRASGGGAVRALAVDAPRGRIAYADERRVHLREADSAERDVLSANEVVALAFAEDGTLFAGSAEGLQRIDLDGRIRSASPAPGDRARIVHSVSAAAGVIAVGGPAGAFVSLDGERWQEVTSGVPAGAVDSVLLRVAPAGAEIWLAVDGEVRFARVERVGDALRIASAQRVSLPRTAEIGDDDVAPSIELSSDPQTHAVVVLAGDRLYVAGDAGWREIRPSLPPGARLARLLVAGERVLVGSDRGLLEAASFDGIFVRAPTPLGTTPVHALAADAGRVLIGTSDGLFEIATGTGASPRTADLSPLDRAPADRFVDPPVQEVYRVALRWLDLGPARLRSLRRGVDRRALLPDVSIGVGRESFLHRGWNRDESFVSGDTRHLFDSDRTRGADLEAKIALSWDLGGLAYPEHAVDLLRESRQVIQLRDDVLDEIAQLYFERRRTLLERVSLDPSARGERERLRLRADELAAGLDAWTGGWFSRHASAPAPDANSSPNPEGVLSDER